MEGYELPSLEEANSFWLTQNESWDCWLAALSMAFQFFGQQFSYSQLLTPLLSTSLKISKKYGGYFPYLAVIANQLGFSGWLLSPITKVRELRYLFPKTENEFVCLRDIDNSEIEQIISRHKKNNNPRQYLFTALKLLCKSPVIDKTFFYSVIQRPNYGDVNNYLMAGYPVIVEVNCKEYYGLANDFSGHLLTFIPTRDSRIKSVVLDGYRDRGYKYFSDWEEHLLCAEHYDWNNWCNWMFVLSPNLKF